MAQLGNKIKIELSAFDMMNILALVQLIDTKGGFPEETLKGSFHAFKRQVFLNITEDGMNEAVAELHLNEMLRDLNKK